MFDYIWMKWEFVGKIIFQLKILLTFEWIGLAVDWNQLIRTGSKWSFNDWSWCTLIAIRFFFKYSYSLELWVVEIYIRFGLWIYIWVVITRTYRDNNTVGGTNTLIAIRCLLSYSLQLRIIVYILRSGTKVIFELLLKACKDNINNWWAIIYSSFYLQLLVAGQFIRLLWATPVP